MYDIETAIEQVSGQTVLCIGDLMLDEFVYGEVSRVSPEAPVPVIAAKRDEKIIGAAGNVARNIASLGARCLLIGVVGADEAGNAIKSAFRVPQSTSRISWSTARADDARAVSSIIRRICCADRGPPGRADVEAELIGLAPHVARVGGGDLRLCQGRAPPQHIRAAMRRPQPGRWWSTPGACCVGLQARRSSRKPPEACRSDCARSRARRTPRRRWSLTVWSGRALERRRRSTRGQHGAAPVTCRPMCGSATSRARAIPGRGAGTLLAVGRFHRLARANAPPGRGASGGTAGRLSRLRSRILPSAALAAEEKIVSIGRSRRRARWWRAQGPRVGFTNGCLTFASRPRQSARQGARRMRPSGTISQIGDASVRLKGEGRQLVPGCACPAPDAGAHQRSIVVCSDGTAPLELIGRLLNRAGQGRDYRKEDVVGRELVRPRAGVVVDPRSLTFHHGHRVRPRAAGDGKRDRRGRTQGESLSVVPDRRERWSAWRHRHQNEEANIGPCLAAFVFATTHRRRCGQHRPHRGDCGRKGACAARARVAGLGAQKNSALSLAQGDWAFLDRCRRACRQRWRA